MQVFDLKHCHGNDLSETALKLAAGKRPDWRFSQGAGASIPKAPADLAICLDVAPSPESYRDLLHGVVDASRDSVLSSGYESPSPHPGIVFFYEPLSQTLAAHPAINKVTR